MKKEGDDIFRQIFLALCGFVLFYLFYLFHRLYFFLSLILLLYLLFLLLFLSCYLFFRIPIGP